MKLTHYTGTPEKPSNVARSVEYDTETNVMIIDFAKRDVEGEAPNQPKRYRYFDVEPAHFEAIRTARETLDEEGKPLSEGSYILKHIVGPRKGPAPYRFEKITEDEAA